MALRNGDTPQSPRKLGERRLLTAALSIAVGVGVFVLLVNFALSTWLWVSPEKRGPWTWVMRVGIATGIQRHDSYWLLGEYYESRRLWPSAVALYRRATRAYARDGELRCSLVRSLFEAEGLSAAEAEAIEASRTLADPLPLAELVLVCDLHGMKTESISVLEKMVELFPQFPGPRKSLIGRYMRKGDTAAARASLQGLLAANPSECFVWMAAAEFHRELAEIEEAKAAYKKAIALDPAQGVILHDYLQFLLELGQEKEAAEFVRSLPPDPLNTDPLYRRLLRLAEEEKGENP